MFYFIRKSLIEGKHILYEIQKFMTVQCLIEWAHIHKPDIINNLLADTQTGDAVSGRSPKAVRWQQIPH